MRPSAVVDAGLRLPIADHTRTAHSGSTLSRHVTWLPLKHTQVHQLVDRRGQRDEGGMKQDGQVLLTKELLGDPRRSGTEPVHARRRVLGDKPAMPQRRTHSGHSRLVELERRGQLGQTPRGSPLARASVTQAARDPPPPRAIPGDPSSSALPRPRRGRYDAQRANHPPSTALSGPHRLHVENRRVIAGTADRPPSHGVSQECRDAFGCGVDGDDDE